MKIEVPRYMKDFKQYLVMYQGHDCEIVFFVVESLEDFWNKVYNKSVEYSFRNKVADEGVVDRVFPKELSDEEIKSGIFEETFFLPDEKIGGSIRFGIQGYANGGDGAQFVFFDLNSVFFPNSMSEQKISMFQKDNSVRKLMHHEERVASVPYAVMRLKTVRANFTEMRFEE